MEELYLSYYTNDLKYTKKEELELFFEYQEVIKDDIKRIRYKVSDYDKSEEKEDLLFRLDNIIKDIVRNRFTEDPEMELNIEILDNYLVFSYYMLGENGDTIKETPSIVIITRDMKNICFVDEEYSVFYEEEENDDFNRGFDEISIYKLNKDEIERFDYILEEYTSHLFDLSFNTPGYFFNHDNIENKTLSKSTQEKIAKVLKKL